MNHIITNIKELNPQTTFIRGNSYGVNRFLRIDFEWGLLLNERFECTHVLYVDYEFEDATKIFLDDLKMWIFTNRLDIITNLDLNNTEP
jgi:hypothetical protein